MIIIIKEKSESGFGVTVVTGSSGKGKCGGNSRWAAPVQLSLKMKEK